MLVIQDVASEIRADIGGDVLVLTVTPEGSAPTRIGLRSSQIQKLLNVLYAGSNLAERQKVGKQNGAAKLAATDGIAAFRPTDFELGQVDHPDEALVLVRL